MDRTNLRKIFLALAMLGLSINSIAMPGDKTGVAPTSDPAKPASTGNENKGDSTAKTDPAKTAPTKRRDPFFSPANYIAPPPPPKVEKKVKPEPKPIPVPAIESRVENYKTMVRDYLAGRGQEPGKLSAYTIEELTLTGIFGTDNGSGAFVVETASRNQQTYFAKSGWQTFDGYIKEILPNGVKFVKITRYDNGSVQQTEIFRPLPIQAPK